MMDTEPITPTTILKENIPPVFDFSKTELARDYTGFYVKIIDNVFTAEECAELIALAESDAKWEQAAVNSGSNPQNAYVDTRYRNSERILRFDHAAAEKIYKKLLPLVPELIEIKRGHTYEKIVAQGSKVYGKWNLVGVNERLSFLRYGPGNFFSGHCDGLLSLPDGRKSRVTIQVYLNEDELNGGTTRIWGSKRKYIDVEPKLGRVLVFQQKDVWHSGEPVIKGMKYTVRLDFMFVNGPEDEDTEA